MRLNSKINFIFLTCAFMECYLPRIVEISLLLHRYRNVSIPFVDGDIWLQKPICSPYLHPTMFRELLEAIRHIPIYSYLGLGKQNDIIEVKALPFESITAKLWELKYLEGAF